ncbi:oligosaccharide flippase family protein [Vibrio japonicus]|uniref:Oligosaccharide flippase family protein n=1 Tax=Vibrio japonicus TaxID=1824638 RepID=A0ABY5LEL0_9VIBR|nr:oligosaccharide flippase family protein [Vibrio japonicus]UUM30467.1 hypothetical protein NP165_12400 [Vibrio japonicus]
MFRVILDFILYRSVNLLFPLLTIPLIVNYTSANLIGELFILQAYSFWLSLFVDFGFIRTAVVDYLKDNEPEKVFNRTLTCQSVLAFLLIIITFPVFLYLKLSLLEIIFVLTTGITQGLVPKWLYQAEARMLQLSIRESASKVLALLFLICLLPKFKTLDTIMLSYILMSVSILLLIVFDYWDKLREFNLSSLSEIKNGFMKSLAVFKMRLVGNGYLNLNVILLSVFSSPEIIAVYGVCERLAKAMASILTAVGEALFPVSVNRENSSLKQDLTISISVSLIPTLIMLMFPNEIINLLLSSNINITMERLIFLTPALFSLSSIFSLCYVTSKGDYKAEFYIQSCILFSSLIGTVLLYSAIKESYPYYSFFLSSIISLVFYALYVLKKEGLRVFN